MARQSAAQKQFLVEATGRYHEALRESPAAEYLAKRGLMGASVAEEVARFRLGYVAEPMTGHEMYRGMLAIPYLRRASDGAWSVVSIRFRCIREGCEHVNHGKYMSLPADRPRLYNPLALITNDDEIGIAEGEIDAMTASVSGIPTVGVPGVEAWESYFTPPFEGYETVYIFADGDDPGIRFATAVAKKLPNAKIVPMAKGEDVNSTVVRRGKAAFLGRLGK